ncbi:MAG: thioesterase family protein [Deltaproteobacteria bacterium]|nr:thioesterase family protein [Deltaproteobacteria bacterium]
MTKEGESSSTKQGGLSDQSRPGEKLPAPFDGYRDVVRSGWIDENGHLNMGYYVVVFDYATDAWLDFIGLSRPYKAAHGVMTFSLESHVTYRRELREGDELRFTTQLLGFDEKRIHYFHQMFHARESHLAATNELMSLHVSAETRRSAPMAREILEGLEEIQRAHRALPIPSQVGRVMGLKAAPTT